MAMNGMLIGEVARRSGVAAPTIRYYEDIGLLRKAARSGAGYRSYSARTIDELLFIKKAQSLGFTLDEIREILKLSRSGQPPCERVMALTRQHVEAIDERIRDLERFRSYLRLELSKWNRSAGSTCDGLCQFIADIELVERPSEIHHGMPKRRRNRPPAITL